MLVHTHVESLCPTEFFLLYSEKNTDKIKNILIMGNNQNSFNFGK